MQRSGTAGSGGRGASGGTGRSGRAGGPGVSGKVVQAGVAIELARRAGRVVRSTEVQQRARELMPAANRLLAAVRREWMGAPATPQDTTRTSRFGRGTPPR